MLRRYLCLTVLALGTVLSISLPAQTWTVARTGLAGINQPNSIAYGKGRFVLSYIPANNVPSLAYSDDGTNWNHVTNSFVGPSGTVVFHQDQFYYASGNGAYRSADGITWTGIATIPGGGFASAQGMATDGQRFMFGSRSRNQPGPLTTSNFVQWTHATPLPLVAPYTNIGPYHPVYGNGRFIFSYSAETANGSNLMDRLASTADGGLTWTNIEGVATSSRAMAFGNNRFVLLGGDRIFTSGNGTDFTSHADMGGLPRSTQNLVFSGGRFVAYRGATFYTSVDGLTWSLFGSVPAEYAQDSIVLTYGKGRYVGVINRRNASSGAMEEFVMVATVPAPPQIARQPQSLSAVTGSTVQITVEADDATGVAYTWYKDGILLPGATSATLTLSNVSDRDAGTYHCVLVNALGSTTSLGATLSLNAPEPEPEPEPGRLVNLSLNGFAGLGEQSLIAGFVIAGSGTKTHYLRGIGPTLSGYGVANALGDPRLTLNQGSTTVASNDNWAIDDGRGVGGFPLPDQSLDATIKTSLAPGAYTVAVSAPNNATGNALVEVYDGLRSDLSSRLINLSARTQLGADQTVIVGFVIGGETSLPIVLRAAGPALSAYGVTNAMADPKLVLYQGQTILAQNDNWSGDDGHRLGAFPLATGSKDSVITTTLAPGAYTVWGSSANTGTGGGIVVIELYEDR